MLAGLTEEGRELTANRYADREHNAGQQFGDASAEELAVLVRLPDRVVGNLGGRLGGCRACWGVMESGCRSEVSAGRVAVCAVCEVRDGGVEHRRGAGGAMSPSRADMSP